MSCLPSAGASHISKAGESSNGICVGGDRKLGGGAGRIAEVWRGTVWFRHPYMPAHRRHPLRPVSG
jgi:hypothetical protein